MSLRHTPSSKQEMPLKILRPSKRRGTKSLAWLGPLSASERPFKSKLIGLVNDLEFRFMSSLFLHSPKFPLSSTIEANLDVFCRYYCGLSMMETRFPISRERDHVHIAFKWFDAFRPTRALEQSSIHYEKAAILFNLGAVISQQALVYDRSTDSGLKDAAKKFQVPILQPYLLLCIPPFLFLLEMHL